MKDVLVLGLTLLLIAVLVISVVRYESMIHEYDPYFNYRSTVYYVSHGYDAFLNWFDTMSWYPLGRIVGGTIFPGLMYTAGLIWNSLHYIGFNVDIKDVCVFISPLFGSVTALVVYLLAFEIDERKSTALLASALFSIVPAYVSRSVAGSFDNESIAIFAMVSTFYTWLKALKTGSFLWSLACSLCYFYMVSSWGGYVYIFNLIPLHVLVLVLLGKYTERTYISFCTFYLLGSSLAMQIIFVGFQHVKSTEHLLALAVFLFLQVYALADWVRRLVGEPLFLKFRDVAIPWAVGLGVLMLAIGLMTGIFSPLTGRFYALLDPTHAKNHIPLIASVSEHQPTTWSSFFMDLHVLFFFFPAGIFFCFQNQTEARIFAMLYGLSSLYFTGVMIRLMLVLSPIACILSAIAVSRTLTLYMSFIDSQPENTPPPSKKQPNKKQSAYFLIAVLYILMGVYVIHCTWVASEYYSSPQLVIHAKVNGERVVYDDFREAYEWLRLNTPPDSTVMAWWDYGYQLTALANRTVIVDNNTWNATHISLVGQAFALDEDGAIKLMRHLGVDYVLVVFGGVTGYSGDDLNKFYWMIRIGSGTNPNLDENDYFSSKGDFRVDQTAPPKLLNSVMYKLSYYRFGEKEDEQDSEKTGYDRARSAEIGTKNISLKYFTEAYTTSHWMVRLYKLKPLPNLPNVLIELSPSVAADEGQLNYSIQERTLVFAFKSYELLHEVKQYEGDRYSLVLLTPQACFFPSK